MSILDNPFIRALFAYTLTFVFVLPLIMAFMPVLSAPDELHSALVYILTQLKQWNFMFPVDTMFYCMSVWFIFEFVYLNLRAFFFFLKLGRSVKT